jgi:hypothetical protein
MMSIVIGQPVGLRMSNHTDIIIILKRWMNLYVTDSVTYAIKASLKRWMKQKVRARLILR